MKLNRKRCLAILELPEEATPDQWRDAYRLMAKVWHPDRFNHDAKLQHHAQEKFKDINLAYEWLKANPYAEDPPPPRSNVSEDSKPHRSNSATSKPECPMGHGPLRMWEGQPRCWKCGWTYTGHSDSAIKEEPNAASNTTPVSKAEAVEARTIVWGCFSIALGLLFLVGISDSLSGYEKDYGKFAACLSGMIIYFGVAWLAAKDTILKKKM